MTLWAEVKVRPNICTKLQSYILKKIGTGAMFIVANKDGKSAYMHPMSQIDALSFDDLVKNIVAMCFEEPNPRALSTVSMSDLVRAHE